MSRGKGDGIIEFIKEDKAGNFGSRTPCGNYSWNYCAESKQ